jgi:hypothetical protein
VLDPVQARPDPQCRLRSVVFEECDLTGADLSGARFDAVDMLGCRLAGKRPQGALSVRYVEMTRDEEPYRKRTIT